MTQIERVRRICKEKGIPVYKLEQDLGFSNGYLNPKKAQSISYIRLLAIADYLDVSIYELTGEEPKIPAITPSMEFVPTDKAKTIPEDDMEDILETLRERPDMRILFKTSKKATPEAVMKVAELLKAFEHDDTD